MLFSFYSITIVQDCCYPVDVKFLVGNMCDSNGQNMDGMIILLFLSQPPEWHCQVVGLSL